MAVCCKGLLIWAVSGKASILRWKKLLPRIASLAGLRRRRSAGMSALSLMDDPLAGQHSVRGELLLLLPPQTHNRNRTQEPHSAISSRETPTKADFCDRNQRDTFHQTVRVTNRRFRNRTHGLWSGFSRHDSSDGKLLTHKTLEQEDNTDLLLADSAAVTVIASQGCHMI